MSLGLLLACCVLLIVAQLGGNRNDSAIAAELPPPALSEIAQTLVVAKTPTNAPTAAPTTEKPKMKQTDSGLQYVDVVEGTGDSPKTGQTVVVHYTGTLQNGTKFDSSRDRGQPFSFKIGVGQVIKGWDEGVGSMKVGGQRQLVIPPDLGYGARGIGPIPPNSTLLFDVELLQING